MGTSIFLTKYKTVFLLQAEDGQSGSVGNGQILTVINEAHEVADTAIETAAHASTGGGGTLFQTYEMIPNGTAIAVANGASGWLTGSAVLAPTEQRLNPEYEQFLEQITNGHNQLHQVANPENILQASTIFQQLKVGSNMLSIWTIYLNRILQLNKINVPFAMLLINSVWAHKKCTTIIHHHA